MSRVTPRIWRLLFPPQSPDEPIDRKLWLGVRVVAAIAALTVAFFASAHVIVGQMMAPNARSKHVWSPECADAKRVRAFRRVKLVMSPR